MTFAAAEQHGLGRTFPKSDDLRTTARRHFQVAGRFHGTVPEIIHAGLQKEFRALEVDRALVQRRLVDALKRALQGRRIADSIPVEYARSQGFTRFVIVLTRNKGYRKKEGPNPFADIFYRKYPHLQEALRNRNAVYNRTMELVESLEASGEAVVIRPEKPIEVGRMEKDTAKLTALYEEGYHQTARKLSI